MMSKDTEIAQLQKQVSQLEKMVRMLNTKLNDVERRLRTVKSTQHQHAMDINTIQRRG